MTGWMSPALTFLQPFLTGFILSLAFVPLCRLLARRTGVVAHPRNDRWHRTTVPLLGGVAIAASILVGSLVTGIAREIAVPLSAAMIVSLTGLFDDVRSLKASTKLIAQLALAAALLYWGYRLHWVESRLLDSLLTMVWVVGLTNAFNLLDNMDGLCAGIAVVVAVMLFAGLWTGVTRELAGTEMTFLAVIAGATAGFLIYNFPPASIFMGDSGALLLGFSLAAVTLNPGGVRGSRSDVLSVIAAPVFVLLIPIFDTTFVTVLRMLSGRSPAVGGRDHSSHRLVAMGLSERTAVSVLWALATIGGVVGITLRSTSQGWSLLVGGLFLLAMCLFAVYLARIRVYESSEAATRAAAVPLVGDFMYKRHAAEVVLDFCLTGIAFYGAYRLRYEGGEYLLNVETFYQALPVVLGAQLVAFFIVGVYRGMWHYFGLMDGVTIVKGVLLGVVTAWLLVFYLFPVSTSRTVFFIYAVLLVMLMTVARASFRLMGEFVQRQRTFSRRAVIYGAGENAAVALKELHDRQGASMKVLGFIDDDPRIGKMRVQGYAVLGTYDALGGLISTRAIDTVVLNREPLDEERLSTIEALCQEHGVSLLRLHVSLEELVSSDGPSPATSLRAQLRKARR